MVYYMILLCLFAFRVGQVDSASVLISNGALTNSVNQPVMGQQQPPLLVSNVVSSDQRPLYNLAHMCNSIKRTLTSLGRGANGVEVDVTFRPDDIYLYHGYPCDCFRFCWDMEPLAKYLTVARQITTPGAPEYNANFVILYFDVKLTGFDEAEKYRSGIRFANYLERHFYEGQSRSTLKLVVSISYANDVDFLRALIHRLRELQLYEKVQSQLGFDVGMDHDYGKIRSMWSRLNVSNVWQGEGITNCFNPILGHQLEKLVHERESAQSLVSKVYRWTIDLSEHIKGALRYNIDGIMTNHPERVMDILREPEFARSYRMASIEDNPFIKYHTLHWSDPGKALTHTSRREKVFRLLHDIRDSAYYFVLEIFHSLIK